MSDQAEQIREALAAFRSQSTSRRYPEAIRKQAAEYVKEELAEGRSIRDVAEAVGLKVSLVRRWAYKSGARSYQPRLLPVTVRGNGGRRVAPGALVVISPSGFRLEGLSFREAVEVMRTLP